MFRLEARILKRQGKKGGTRSMAGVLAYRLGLRLESENDTHDYSRKAIEQWGAIGAVGEGRWTQDPQLFASAVDKVERRKDSQLGREIILSLDRRIPSAKYARLVDEWAKSALPPNAAGFYAIHAARALDGGNNPHAHVVFANRPVEGQGFGRKFRQSPKENTAELNEWRIRWAELQNQELERIGLTPDLDPEKRKREAQEPPPEPKLGVALYAASADGPFGEWSAQRRRKVFEIREARRQWLLQAHRVAKAVRDGVRVGIDALRRSELSKRLLLPKAEEAKEKEKGSAKRARQSRAQRFER